MTATPKVPYAERAAELEKEIERLEAELSGEDPQAIINRHIRRLHRYNEIKDGTQSLIAKYAVMTNQTVRQVHEELELPLKD
ncbi:hypothetical protein BD324DRAFT_650574 [Kockovaella imperatae]|uniref:Swi5-domain-containing protein n=1 Tax=Kockovaella imperatae TaxID=4999 RepID=A0A1Y1UJ06_9TREE|nr:hypothetical protein BD324DRAFT_650574 [Kockovaella imperatae]ORX38040.1 hypothetical protein BD324DRAFT_650574 [Kockovaella imperatae]